MAKDKSANAEPVFDDDEGAPSAHAGKDGRNGQDAADPDHGEASRFSDDFETETETDAFQDVWISGGTLPTIPTRPGYVQRYINTTDGTNLSNQIRRGWVFRRAETLPEGFRATPTIQHGEYEGFIGVNGQVLAEMPIALWRRHEQAVRAQTEKLEQAVEQNLYRVKSPGMAATPKESWTQASVGRVPTIPDE